MRHPLESFVKAELAYRADPWNPGVRDGIDVRGIWGTVRRRGRRHAGQGHQAVPPALAMTPPRDIAATSGSAPTDRSATIHPFPPRQPDAA